jgi:hypothetical protein
MENHVQQHKNHEEHHRQNDFQPLGSDVMKPIAAPIVGGMITSTIHVLILIPVFFELMKERALRHGDLREERATNGG